MKSAILIATLLLVALPQLMASVLEREPMYFVASGTDELHKKDEFENKFEEQKPSDIDMYRNDLVGMDDEERKEEEERIIATADQPMVDVVKMGLEEKTVEKELEKEEERELEKELELELHRKEEEAVNWNMSELSPDTSAGVADTGDEHNAKEVEIESEKIVEEEKSELAAETVEMENHNFETEKDDSEREIHREIQIEEPEINMALQSATECKKQETYMLDDTDNVQLKDTEEEIGNELQLENTEEEMKIKLEKENIGNVQIEAAIVDNVECPMEETGYAIQIPSSIDCAVFYKCDRGVAHKIVCPGGLHYNTLLMTCDFPLRAGCNLEL